MLSTQGSRAACQSGGPCQGLPVTPGVSYLWLTQSVKDGRKPPNYPHEIGTFASQKGPGWYNLTPLFYNQGNQGPSSLSELGPAPHLVAHIPQVSVTLESIQTHL